MTKFYLKLHSYIEVILTCLTDTFGISVYRKYYFIHMYIYDAVAEESDVLGKSQHNFFK